MRPGSGTGITKGALRIRYHHHIAMYPEKSDLEKNVHVVDAHRTKALLSAIIILEVVAIVILIQNREVIDNVHQMLNSVLLGVLTAGFAQSIIQLFRRVHYGRLFKFCLWGAMNGVMSSVWIDTLVVRLETPLHRILTDQFIGTPIFQTIFIIYNSLWENIDIKGAFKSVSKLHFMHCSQLLTRNQTFWRMLGTSYLIWPVCSIVSFNFLPQHLIFPFTCFVNVIWTLALGLII